MEQNKIEQTVKLINDYITAYNNFDIEGMANLLDENIEFKNISHGEVTDHTEGIDQFRLLANQNKTLFKQREQKIQNINLSENSADVDIIFTAVMAISTPDGLRAGQTINFKGSSAFIFKNGKISKIHDIS